MFLLLDVMNRKKSPAPSLFEAGTKPFWQDAHIAKQMLEAHLDPTTERGSRHPEFIDRSVNWLNTLIPEKSKILDLGCGPGLYTERLAAMGHSCSGIDFSEVSISYAQSLASRVTYTYDNYLTADWGEDYDLIILVYCDFGVFSPQDQSQLLHKINASLKKGGIFVLDAFTKAYFDNFPEEFECSELEGGFWSTRAHQLIKESYRYPDCLTVMGQYQLMEANRKEIFRVWSMCYEVETFHKLMEEHGFHSIERYGNVCGDALEEGSEVVALCIQK